MTDIHINTPGDYWCSSAVFCTKVSQGHSRHHGRLLPLDVVYIFLSFRGIWGMTMQPVCFCAVISITLVRPGRFCVLQHVVVESNGRKRVYPLFPDTNESTQKTIVVSIEMFPE